VKELDFGGVSVLKENLRLLPYSAQSRLRIVVAHHGGFIHVRVTDKDENPIPPLLGHRNTDGGNNGRGGSCDVYFWPDGSNGMWTSDALRPGRYYVVASRSQPIHTAEAVMRLMVGRLHNNPVEVSSSGDVTVSREAQD
jgi:hypothetical protein